MLSIISTIAHTFDHFLYIRYTPFPVNLVQHLYGVWLILIHTTGEKSKAREVQDVLTESDIAEISKLHSQF